MQRTKNIYHLPPRADDIMSICFPPGLCKLVKWCKAHENGPQCETFWFENLWIFIMISFFLIVSSLIWILQGCQKLDRTRVHFIYILDSSNSSSFTFWTSQFTSSSRCNWTFISTGHSTGSWNDKHSSHFSTAKEISVKATFFFM